MTCTLPGHLLRTKWELMLSGRSLRRSTRRSCIRKLLAVLSSRIAWTPASLTKRACPTSIASSTTGCRRLKLAFRTAITLAWSSTLAPQPRRKECSSISKTWRRSTKDMRTGTQWPAWSRTCLRRPRMIMWRRWHRVSWRSPSKLAEASSIFNDQHRITSYYWKSHSKSLTSRAEEQRKSMKA